MIILSVASEHQHFGNQSMGLFSVSLLKILCMHRAAKAEAEAKKKTASEPSSGAAAAPACARNGQEHIDDRTGAAAAAAATSPAAAELMSATGEATTVGSSHMETATIRCASDWVW